MSLPDSPADPGPTQHLEILNEVARIATLDLELRPMLQRITDALHRKFGWELVALAMVEPSGDQFVCEAVTSSLPTDVHPGYSRALGSGVVGEVAATEQPVVVDDVRTYPNYVDTMKGTASEICVPIKHAGRLVGVLNVESTRPAEFHDALTLLTTVADQIAGAIASARMYEELKHRVRLMEMITEISRTALEATDLDELLGRVVRYIHARFPVSIVVILTHDKDRREFVLQAAAGDVGYVKGTRRSIDTGIVGRCIRTGQTQLVRDAPNDPDYIMLSPSTCAELVIPIRFRNEILGVLDLESESADVFSPENVLAFMAFADQIVGAIRVFRLNQQLDTKSRELLDANAHLTTISTTDGLTSVANRRHFDTVLAHEWRRAARHQLPISLLLIDVDHFKFYNDTYGHQAGDECLRKVAAASQTMFQRAGDLVARYGGEEFAILLADAAEEEACRAAEALRQRIEGLGIEHRSAETGVPVITVSIGVASVIPPRNEQPDFLIASADHALYQAKRQGRNRVICK